MFTRGFIGQLLTKENEPFHQRSTSNNIHHKPSDIDNDITDRLSSIKSPALPSVERNENYPAHARIHQRTLSPLLPLIERKANVSKTKEPTVPVNKPKGKSELDNKWQDFFNDDNDRASTKTDLLSKLVAHEPTEKKYVSIGRMSPISMESLSPSPSPSSSTAPPAAPSRLPPPVIQRPTMIMFEPSTISSNARQSKPPARVTTTGTNYDFDQAIINLHEGKPSSKTSIDPFDTLLTTKTNKPTTHSSRIDETNANIEPFDEFIGLTISTKSTATTDKMNSARLSLPVSNEKVQRSKLASNPTKPMVNKAFVDEIDEFFL
jgi:hypothetical protein